MSYGNPGTDFRRSYLKWKKDVYVTGSNSSIIGSNPSVLIGADGRKKMIGNVPRQNMRGVAFIRVTIWACSAALRAALLSDSWETGDYYLQTGVKILTSKFLNYGLDNCPATFTNHYALARRKKKREKLPRDFHLARLQALWVICVAISSQ